MCEWKQAQDRYYRGTPWTTSTNDALHHDMNSDQSIRDHQPWREDTVDGAAITQAYATDSDDSTSVHEYLTPPNLTHSTSPKGDEMDANHSVASTQASRTTPATIYTPFDIRILSPSPSFNDSSSLIDPREDDRSRDSGSARTIQEPGESIEHEEVNPTPLAIGNPTHDKQRTGETWMTIS